MSAKRIPAVTDEDVHAFWHAWFNPNLTAPIREPNAGDYMDRMSLDGIRRGLENDRRRLAEATRTAAPMTPR